MRYLYQFIMGTSLLFSSCTYAALDFYADVLYWQPSETVDWSLTNSNISSSVQANQALTYNTIHFDFAPGFRVGAGLQQNDWTERLLYTRYHVQTNASTSGNVISAFMPSKFTNKFYQAANVQFGIDFNMFDLDLSKQIRVDNMLVLNPYIGLRGGWINQQVNTRYLNPIAVPATNYNPHNVLEQVSNHFSGLGPKVGIGEKWVCYKKDGFQTSLIGDFTASYLWGRWFIHDTLYQDDAEIIGAVDVGNRDFGAFAVQGLIGIHLEYQNYALKVGYEASDWFNQYQVFDNGSGTHTNDLVLQGLTVAFHLHWA